MTGGQRGGGMLGRTCSMPSPGGGSVVSSCSIYMLRGIVLPLPPSLCLYAFSFILGKYCGGLA